MHLTILLITSIVINFNYNYFYFMGNYDKKPSSLWKIEKFKKGPLN